MANAKSNGHVTDDVTWPWNVKVVTLICLLPIIWAKWLEMDMVPKDH